MNKKKVKQLYFDKIKEFRENSEKLYRVLYPPMISIIPKIEEETIVNHEIDTNGDYLLKNNNIIENINTIQIKKKYEISNDKSTLKKYMNLKIL